MPSAQLGFSIRTPLEVVHEGPTLGLRVSLASGWVGLRPGTEPVMLAVEPGLLIMRGHDGLTFAATAGGLLESDGVRCTLYTPFATLGDSPDAMVQALDGLLATPTPELAARRQLDELEQQIVHELRDGHRGALPRTSHHE